MPSIQLNMPAIPKSKTRIKTQTIGKEPEVTRSGESSGMNFKITVSNMCRKIDDKMEDVIRE